MSDVEELKRRKEELRLKQEIAALERKERLVRDGPRMLLIVIVVLVGTFCFAGGLMTFADVGGLGPLLTAVIGVVLLVYAYRKY